MSYIDLRQTSDYTVYLKNIGWHVEKIGRTHMFLKQLPLLGNFIKIQRPSEIVPVRILIDLASKEKIFSVVVEPLDERQKQYYKTQFFKRSKTSSLPSKTIWIDLAKSEKLLLSEMHYKTRYNIGLAKRKGVRVKSSGNIFGFTQLWQQSAKKRGMFLSLEKEIIEIYNAFGKNAEILYAHHKDEIVAGIMLLHAPETSYYMYAFSKPGGNKIFAPSLVAWEGILSSKRRKKKFFDFEGIYDDRYPLSGWKGFTRFKESFGGDIVEFPEPIIRSFFRLW